jgi:hypothetical protein
MQYLIALLRLIHIFSATAWFGIGATMAMYIAPTVLAAGENGYRYMKSLLTSTRIATAFPMVSGIAMLAGILLYFTGDVANFSRVGQIVLGIGALAGIAAGIHGGAVAGRALRTFGETLAKYPDNQPIPADGLTTLHEQAAAVASHARVSFALVVIALIGMGSARFL